MNVLKCEITHSVLIKEFNSNQSLDLSERENAEISWEIWDFQSKPQNKLSLVI